MRIDLALLAAMFTLLYLPLFSQTAYWADLPESSLRNAAEERWIVPSEYRTVALDIKILSKLLDDAPARFNGAGNSVPISLPMPDGSNLFFAIQEAPLFEPDLAAAHPDIRTYTGQGITNQALSVYLDLTPMGLHAMVIGPGQTVFIDPYFRGNRSFYVSYDKNHFSKENGHDFDCGYEPGDGPKLPKTGQEPGGGLRSASISLRTYRAAIAATGEYTQFHGSASNALAAIVTTLNRVRGIYETELAISFTLIGNNSSIIYTNPATDPYSDNPTLAENQANIDAVIGSTNYDIGHLVDIGTGGLAGLGIVCNNASKAWGKTGAPSPKGDPFDVDYVAHEMGHQFSANHTFNGNEGSCSGSNRNASTAYEPGSGNTIMSYSGLCGTQNIQWNSETHFHKSSLLEITTYVTTGSGSSCPTVTATGNNTPTVNANAMNVNGKYIPINTPFELTASGSDPDGNAISYCWEQWDLGAAGAPTSSSTGPTFRSFMPANGPTRTFPRLSDILDNSSSFGEKLPSITRDLHFDCTVRDAQAGGGGFAHDGIVLHVTNSADAFAIASQNSSANVQGSITINWNVGNTTAAPVSCANVDIMLSLDGGHNFSPLLTGTPNDGSQAVTLPNSATGQARLKVKCSDNVFFDMNNADLRIVPADATCNEQVNNGDFAAGGSNWLEYSSNNQQLIANWGDSYSGSNSAWLGYLPNETSRISQTLAIPSSPHFAKLTFWYKLLKFDCGGDVFRLKVNGSTLHTFSLCNNDAAVDWKREIVDLGAYAGTSPTIMFELVTNADNQTDVLIDAISLYTCTGGAFAPLPVELVDFQAFAEGKNARLTWQTESETNNLGFDIEQQGRGGAFEKIGHVSGHGTSTERHHYQFLVNELPAGFHYFRLRQIDLDGTHSYSPVRAVRIDGPVQVGVFPNPANDVVFFEMSLPKASHLRLEVLSTTGHQVGLVTDERYISGEFQLPFEVQGLPSGMYFFRLTGEGFEENGRFLVE